MTTQMKCLALIASCAVIAALPADAVAQATPPDLREASLEELLSLQVTSAGRRQQRAEDVAGAVYVITQDDIRRSGLRSLPEILRLAPGVQVAQVSANKWAVSVRGFNSLYSNKLLILIDGRSLYNRAFAGVFWDANDLDVAEIERIEIVRGPGGAMWGSNAVNGVINIISRSARVSTGGAISVSLGTFERSRVTARYGSSLGRAAYRVFGQWSGYADGLTAEGSSANDRWHSITGGTRVDWANENNTLMAAGHYTTARSRPNLFVLESIAPDVYSIGGMSDTREASALGRWTRTMRDGSVFQAQTYTTHVWRDEATFESVERTGDLDIQYEKPLGRRHALVLGGGYRYFDLATNGSLLLQIAPEQAHIANAFAQDEFAVTPALKLTVGARVEYEKVAGWGLSPSVRAIWEPTPRQRVWAAAARVRRTPAATDRTLRINFFSMPGPGLPILLAITGNPDYGIETLTQLDAGYRVRLGSTASLDLAVFRGRYDDLATLEPRPLVLETTPAPAHLLLPYQFTNLMSASTAGAELAVHWSPLDTWRLDASYSALRITPSIDASSLDELAPLFDGNAPRRQWHARSTWWAGSRTQVHTALYRSGALPQLLIPAYTRLDAGVEVTLRDGLTAALTGQNLLDPSHEEFSGFASGMVGSAVPRSARVQLRWQY